MGPTTVIYDIHFVETLSFSALQYYDNCIEEIRGDHCKPDTLYPPSPDVLEYALDLQIKYRWTCVPRTTECRCSLVMRVLLL